MDGSSFPFMCSNPPFPEGIGLIHPGEDILSESLLPGIAEGFRWIDRGGRRLALRLGLALRLRAFTGSEVFSCFHRGSVAPHAGAVNRV